MEKKEACTYCPYGGICGFDERIDGFSYRDLKKEKQEEILAKMREEI
jgi:ATP-dependent helicase/nuclease subunit B